MIEQCSVTNSLGRLTTECIFRNDTTARGLQVIAQLVDASAVHRLYTNQSAAPLTPVTVLVERDGVYQIAVFAIEIETGILNSFAEFTQRIAVDDVPDIVTNSISGINIITCYN